MTFHTFFFILTDHEIHINEFISEYSSFQLYIYQPKNLFCLQYLLYVAISALLVETAICPY